MPSPKVGGSPIGFASFSILGYRFLGVPYRYLKVPSTFKATSYDSVHPLVLSATHTIQWFRKVALEFISGIYMDVQSEDTDTFSLCPAWIMLNQIECGQRECFFSNRFFCCKRKCRSCESAILSILSFSILYTDKWRVSYPADRDCVITKMFCTAVCCITASRYYPCYATADPLLVE